MRSDPRCRRLNELSAQYHLLFRQLTERYLAQECADQNFREPLCLGDYSFLYLTGEAKQGVSMAELAKQLNVNPSTVTRQATRLLSNGLITKSSDPKDDRRYEIRLTKTGQSLVERMNERQYQAVQKTYENVTDEELQCVYHYMEKCIHNLMELKENED